MLQQMTGYPSIDKPWLKFYREEDINSSLPTCSIYEYIWSQNKNYPNDIAIRYLGNAVTEIGNGAGNAETVSIATTPAGVENKPETVGIVLVGSSAIVIDPETMQEKPYGEEGMLCIAGKHVLKNIIRNPS